MAINHSSLMNKRYFHAQGSSAAGQGQDKIKAGKSQLAVRLEPIEDAIPFLNMTCLLNLNQQRALVFMENQCGVFPTNYTDYTPTLGEW